MITKDLLTLLSAMDALNTNEVPAALTQALREEENQYEQGRKNLEEHYQAQLNEGKSLMESIQSELSQLHTLASRYGLQSKSPSPSSENIQTINLQDLQALQTSILPLKQSLLSELNVHDANEKKRLEDEKRQIEKARKDEIALKEQELKDRERETRKTAWSKLWIPILFPLLIFLFYIGADAAITFADTDGEAHWRPMSFTLLPAVLLPILFFFLEEDKRKIGRWLYAALGLLPIIYLVTEWLENYGSSSFGGQLYNVLFYYGPAVFTRGLGELYHYSYSQAFRIFLAILAIFPTIAQIVIGLKTWFLYVDNQELKTVTLPSMSRAVGDAVETNGLEAEPIKLSLIAALPALGSIIWTFIDGISFGFDYSFVPEFFEYLMLALMILALLAATVFRHWHPDFYHLRWRIYRSIGIVLSLQFAILIFERLSYYSQGFTAGIEWRSHFSYSFGNPGLFLLFGLAITGIGTYLLSKLGKIKHKDLAE